MKDFGLDPFYERFWGTLSVVDGNKVKRTDGGTFDAGCAGRLLVLKFADATRYPGLKVAGYYHIKSVIDDQTIDLVETPDVAVQNEAGYICGDNSEKFRKLLAVALGSGKVYKISVPKGVTLVLPGGYAIDNTKGGVHFVSEPTDDPYTGGAQFKFMTEEEYAGASAWFAFSRPVGEFDVVFENINLVARDNYSFKKEDDQTLFALPSMPDIHKGFTLKVSGCNFAYEYRKFDQDVRAYLRQKFGAEADVDALRALYYLHARNKLLKTLSAGREGRPFVWHLEYVDAWYGRYYQVGNTLYNSSRELAYTCVMKHVKAYGSMDHGRNGINAKTPLKPLVTIGADPDGDFTQLTLSADSPIGFDFSALRGMYDTFSRKRPGHEIGVKIPGVTDGTEGRRRSGIFINSTKNSDGTAARLGTVRNVLERGDGIYDVILDRDPHVVYQTVGNTAGGFERMGGVIQYDYIASDRRGELMANETSDKPTALINPASGYPNDYRGWVRYVYGDSANGRYADGRVDWPEGDSAWLWIDNDAAAGVLAEGSRLYVINAAHRGRTVVVEAGGFVKWNGAAAPSVAPEEGINNRYIEIAGKFYEYGKVAPYTPYPAGTGVGGYYPIEVKNLDCKPGTYEGCNIWYETVVKKVQAEPGIGVRVNVWSTDKTPAISLYYGNFFAAGSEARPGHPANPAAGKLLYAFNVKTGNRKAYPGGAPFTKGETLYAYYLGTGGFGKAVTRNCGKAFILPKEWEVEKAVSAVPLEAFSDSRSDSTHWVYGKHTGIVYEWEDVRFCGGNIALVIRDGGANTNGSVFKNCDLSYGGGMQIGGPLTLDGGTYKVYGGGGPLTVRNSPTLLGAIEAFTIRE